MTPAVTIRGIHHIAIRTRDLDASLRFYTGALGCTVRHTWSMPEREITRAAMLKTGDGLSFIELFEYKDSPAPERGDARAGSDPAGNNPLLHLAVTVDNAETAYRKAVSCGCRPCSPPGSVMLGEPPVPVRNAVISGPDGEILEFIEPGGF